MIKLIQVLCFIFVTVGCQTSSLKTKEPNTKKAEIILDHKYFIVSYNPLAKLPNWVSYHLYAKNLKNKIAKRKNKFFADPQLIQMNLPYAKPNSFDGKIYDRGHMSPSEDFTFDQGANDETFVMTNMAPQTKKLNRGAWKVLENTVRKWACASGELLVISGPIIESDLEKFSSGVYIPKRFFKVILDETYPRKAIGFIYNQTDVGPVLEKNVVTINELEHITGETFLDELTDAEKNIKTESDIKKWAEADCS